MFFPNSSAKLEVVSLCQGKDQKAGEKWITKRYCRELGKKRGESEKERKKLKRDACHQNLAYLVPLSSVVENAKKCSTFVGSSRNFHEIFRDVIDHFIQLPDYTILTSFIRTVENLPCQNTIFTLLSRVVSFTEKIERLHKGEHVI